MELKNLSNGCVNNAAIFNTKMLLIIIFLLSTYSSAFSQPTHNHVNDTTKQIASEVLSPYCPGRTLADCPSSNASNLKEEIRKKITEGQTKEQVLAYLYKLYGDGIRAAPRFGGFGIWAWITPFIFLLVGILMATVWLKYNCQSNDSESEDNNESIN